MKEEEHPRSGLRHLDLALRCGQSAPIQEQRHGGKSRNLSGGRVGGRREVQQEEQSALWAVQTACVDCLRR